MKKTLIFLFLLVSIFGFSSSAYAADILTAEGYNLYPGLTLDTKDSNHDGYPEKIRFKGYAFTAPKSDGSKKFLVDKLEIRLMVYLDGQLIYSKKAIGNNTSGVTVNTYTDWFTKKGRYEFIAQAVSTDKRFLKSDDIGMSEDSFIYRIK